MEGVLVYNFIEDRYQLEYGIEKYSNCFHAGEHLKVLINDNWISTRIEFDNKKWYLVGIKDEQIDGLFCRSY